MLFQLIGIRFRAMFASMLRGTKKQKAGGTGTKVLMAVLFVYVAGVFFFLFGSMFFGLGVVFLPDSAWLYFTVAGFLLVALDLVTGIFMAQSQLFGAKDNELLFSMPLSPGLILGSRLVFLLLYEYVTSLPVILPAMAVYGILVGYTLPSFFMTLCGFLMLPLLAQTFSCLIGWLLAALTSRCKHKNLVNTILSLAFLGLYFYVCFNSSQLLEYLIQNGAEMIRENAQLLYPFVRFGEAVAGMGTGGGWLNFLILLGVCLVPFGLLLLLLSKTSLRLVTATASGGAARRHSAGKRAAVTRSRGTRSVTGALVSKELRHFFSSTPYLLNTGMGLVFIPIAVVAAILKRPDLDAFIAAAGLPGMEQYLLPVFAVVECFILTMCPISAPSVSLEGNNLWMLKALPVDGGRILVSKAYLQMIVCLPFVAVSGIVLNLFFAGSILARLLLILFPAVFCVMLSLIGAFINLRMPRFDWVDETATVKQSMSILVSMLLGFAALLIPVIGYIPLAIFTSLAPEIYLAVCTVLLAGVSWMLYRSLLHSGERFARLG